MQRANSVDEYIKNASHWGAELQSLRAVLKKTRLTEEVKWGGPCYTYNDKNVVGIGAFKSYFGLWFHQGAMLKDDASVLINAQEGKTKALRQWRMHDAKDIRPAIIKRYISEAISLVEAGKEIKADRNKAIDVPAELQQAMRRHKGASAAFRLMQKGLQREYADYVAGAKRAETKQRRIEKILPMIAKGVGLNDKYR